MNRDPLPGRLRSALNRDRLVQTAKELIAVPSPTGQAGAVLDRAAEMLENAGFAVRRAAGGHESAPAVVARFDSGEPGRVIQFDGHLDTVHLPFCPPRLEGDWLRGSGASDMKSGVAASIEAVRMLQESGLLKRGAVLLTLHDLHEAPWGRGEQLDRLIGEGIVGDGVLLPEPFCDHLPVAGRGAATWKVILRRSGPPVHEVHRPADQPSVIAAGAELVRLLQDLDKRLQQQVDPIAGRASVFIGQFHSGEIYNQFPQEAMLEGTRRWLPGASREAVEAEMRTLFDNLARDCGVEVDWEFRLIRDAFRLDLDSPLVTAFQRAYSAVVGQPLPTGPKPFVDDGNSFSALAGVAAITHGPRAGGQHTVDEWVSLDDLERVALVYALTAALFCDPAAQA
ncbi:MAG: M20/M25/M40 family metallo-hydrolase [Gemmatales bacterium]|nr:M20/M25/M40 family metallo-hydrolase [Gemmatales bacterium]MDW8387803.1 M20/M25/M40 family metallo-hydrolase [Gemmatales bacterium]